MPHDHEAIVSAIEQWQHVTKPSVLTGHLFPGRVPVQVAVVAQIRVLAIGRVLARITTEVQVGGASCDFLNPQIGLPIVHRQEHLIPVHFHIARQPHTAIRGKELTRQINRHHVIHSGGIPHFRRKRFPLAVPPHLDARSSHAATGLAGGVIRRRVRILDPPLQEQHHGVPWLEVSKLIAEFEFDPMRFGITQKSPIRPRGARILAIDRLNRLGHIGAFVIRGLKRSQRSPHAEHPKFRRCHADRRHFVRLDARPNRVINRQQLGFVKKGDLFQRCEGLQHVVTILRHQLRKRQILSRIRSRVLTIAQGVSQATDATEISDKLILRAIPHKQVRA